MSLGVKNLLATKQKGGPELRVSVLITNNLGVVRVHGVFHGSEVASHAAAIVKRETGLTPLRYDTVTNLILLDPYQESPA